MSSTGLDAADFYVAQRQLRWLGHVSRMDFGRLPRRMLSAWVPHQRLVGATRLTSGSHAATRWARPWTSLTLTLRAGTSLWATGLWRTMLSERAFWFPRFRAPPPPPLPMPISHFLARPRRAAATATMTEITNSLAALDLSTASGGLHGGDD